jgi:hypothetical protein
MAASVAVGSPASCSAGCSTRRPAAIPASLGRALSAPHRVLLNKYYVDEIYRRSSCAAWPWAEGHALHDVDRYVVDGGGGEVRPGLGVNGVAWGVREVIARLSNLWDRYVVDARVNLIAFVLDT